MAEPLAAEGAERLYPLEGRVVDSATGEPVEGLRVTFERKGADSGGNTYLGKATSRSNGSFRADQAPVPAGRVAVYVGDSVGLPFGTKFGPLHLELPLSGICPNACA